MKNIKWKLKIPLESLMNLNHEFLIEFCIICLWLMLFAVKIRYKTFSSSSLIFRDTSIGGDVFHRTFKNAKIFIQTLERLSCRFCYKADCVYKCIVLSTYATVWNQHNNISSKWYNISNRPSRATVRPHYRLPTVWRQFTLSHKTQWIYAQ